MSEGTRVLNGRYEIHRLIARGGMAEVFLARDRLLDRPVAVKILVPEFATDSSFVERFRREAQAAANLAHPNIVGIYDWGAEEGTYFIVMEFVDGRPLSQVLRTDGRLHPRRAAEITAEVAAALGAAHTKGLVHRDVKPGNVLIAQNGVAKVADFGIARALAANDDDLTQHGSVMGTATYFSPEQAQGLPVDGRSDLYSLGVVLFEMVTGRAPFSGDTPLAIAYQHVQDPVPRPSAFEPGVPPGLEAIILKLLAKKPELRYANADELRADLRRFLNGEQTLAERGVAPGAAAVAAAAYGDQPTIVQPSATTMQPAAAVVDEEVEEERPARTGMFVALLVLLLAALGGLVWWFTTSYLADDTTLVDVPNVVGQSQPAATAELETRGFRVEVLEVAGTEADEGDVIAQNPPGGDRVAEGATVEISVSTGPGTVAVPNVVGRSQRDAEAMIRGQNLALAPVQSVEDDSADPGTVIRTDPAAGAEVSAGTEVTLFVAAAPGEVVVPSLEGSSFDAARGRLEGEGFRVRGPREEASSTVARGQVIRTDPAAGSSIRRGSEVTVFVSSGPELVRVPTVEGQTEASATQTLQGRGFDVRVATEQVDDGAPGVGRVIGQTPDGGEQVEPGSTVTITIGVARPTTTTTSTTTSTTTAAPAGEPAEP